MASTPLDTIPEETTVAPTPPPSPAPAAAATTTPTPTPARVTANPPQRKPAKNAGRVASGKRLAERNRIAREAKKKAEAEAASASTSASTSASSATTASDSGGGFSLLTWLGIGGLIVSAAGVYYQREAIQARFRTAPAPAPAQTQTPSPAPALSRIPVRQGIKKME